MEHDLVKGEQVTDDEHDLLDRREYIMIERGRGYSSAIRTRPAVALLTSTTASLQSFISRN